MSYYTFKLDLKDYESFRPLISKAVTEVLKQGEPAVTPTCLGQLTCSYRTPHGAKCAVGHLIKDEFYHSNLEGHGAHSEEVLDALRDSWPEVNFSGKGADCFFKYFQKEHDRNRESENFSFHYARSVLGFLGVIEGDIREYEPVPNSIKHQILEEILSLEELEWTDEEVAQLREA